MGGSYSCSSKNWQWFGPLEESNEVSQQNLKVNWSGVLGLGGVGVTTGSCQVSARGFRLGGTEF